MQMVLEWSKENLGSSAWVNVSSFYGKKSYQGKYTFGMLMSPSLVENHFEKIFWPPIAYMRLSVFFSQPIKNKNRHQSCPAKRVQFSCLRAWLAWFRLIAFFACVVSLFIVSGGSLPPIAIVCCD